jgi:disulfide bond formation protein DsbB
MKNLIGKSIEYFSFPRPLAAALALTCLCILAFVYTAQYAFGYLPCILCLYQRIPYYVALALSIAAFALSGRHEKAARGMLLLCGCAFFAGLCLSGYHVGVEMHWWMGPQACGGGLPENASIEQLRAYITSRPIVDCSVPAWKFLGISMTGYNFIISFSLTVKTFFLTLRRWKHG